MGIHSSKVLKIQQLHWLQGGTAPHSTSKTLWRWEAKYLQADQETCDLGLPQLLSDHFRTLLALKAVGSLKII